jgi:hypothetical protein
MEQGTAEWLEARRGNFTASRFGDLLADPSTARYQGYITEVVNEIIGVPDFDDGEYKPWFWHGKQWEAEARASYEFETGRTVVEDSLIMSKELYYVGCSPDGLVGDDGGIEIKCRKSWEAFLKSVEAEVDSIHVPQIQGCMWVTERQWWDYISYFKAPESADYDMHIHRVYRDEAYINRLRSACRTAWIEVQQRLEKYYG